MTASKNIRWLRLVLGMIAIFFAGIIYAWSILKAPFAADFAWTKPQLALNFTITLCFFCIGSVVSGLAAGKTSPRLRLIVGALLLCAGFLIVSRLSGASLAPLYLAYGVMAGLGIGITYNTVIAATGAWFPDKSGLCSGALMMSFGFSTLLLGSLAGKLMATDFGWRSTYTLLGLMIGGVILVCAFFIRFPKPDEIDGFKKAQAASAPAVRDYSSKELFHMSSFYKLFIFFILLSAVGSTAISFARDFFIASGIAEATAITIVGILSVCNGLGRLISGALFDWKGLRLTQYVTSCVAIAGPVVVLIALMTNSAVLGVVGMCICGLSYGFAPTVTVAFCTAFYGRKYFPLNFSLLTLVLIPASFVSTLAGSLVASTGSYVSTFILLLAFSIAGLFINMSLKSV